MNRVFFFIVLVLPLPASHAAELIASRVALHHSEHGYEAQLVNAIEKIRNQDVDDAIEILEHLTRSNPKFRLAQLMYADLLLSRSRPVTEFGNFSPASYEKLALFRDEARARWLHYFSQPPKDRIPASLVRLNALQKHVVVVDMDKSRLFLFENRDGIPYLIRDFYSTIGKSGFGKIVEGDQKTPEGVYFVTGFIDPEELPDLYGDGAFPIDYPNAWDQRHGRTGYGIWLHGTPSNTYSRPPRDSNGCVIVSNQDLNEIAPYMEASNTPVILTRSINWLDRNTWLDRQIKLEKNLLQWRADWESKNANRYLSHYSRNYSGLGKDYRSWVEYKRRVNSNKKFIKVGITNQSMFLYPGEKGLLVVTFEQDYVSDNYRRKFTKRQYWKREKDGRWRIVYEGSVS